jgi:membrane protease YdiL (CAAX protease family)
VGKSLAAQLNTLGDCEFSNSEIMDKNKTSKISFPWNFFGLTFLLTWACWIPAGLLPTEQYGVLSKILLYAGGIMPTLATLLLLYLYSNHQERRDYWQRLIDLKRIDKVWYAVILLTVPFLTIIGVVFDLVLGGTGAEPEAASNIILNPLSLITFAIFMLLFGPLPEEMAWRGYALDGLQARWNALSASLILGAAWTLWHLPLFLIEGSYQHGLGVGTQQFWLYMLDKLPQSIVMTWIYNNNKRSTASAVLFHFMVNFVGELFDLSRRAETIYIASWWIMALLVITIWKPQRFVLLKSRTQGVRKAA